VAVIACRVKPPLERVARDHQCSWNETVAGDLRVRANVDERRAGSHRLSRFVGVPTLAGD
jgi:hypothetical protein